MLVMAYRGFRDFLYSPPTWENYKRLVLDPYPAVLNCHRIFGVMMGGIDKIRPFISSISPQKYLDILNKVDEEKLREIYHSVMAKCMQIIQPTDEIDVYFMLSPFMPVSMSLPASGKMNIVLSVAYDIKLIPLVLCHEYGHCIFVPRMAGEDEIQKFTDELSEEKFEQLIRKLWFDRPLKWGMINEGFASYFPKLVFPECSIYDCLWMMQKDAVDWCMNNERKLKNNIRRSFEEYGIEVRRKYMMAGPLANPPEGFPRQTMYYVGYRVVENCLKKISLEKFFSLKVDDIISVSGYFDKGILG